MGKVLVFVIAAIVGWFLFKGLVQKPGRGRSARANPPDGVIEKMVVCDLCGVHMPESETVLSGDKRSCRVPAQCAHRRES